MPTGIPPSISSSTPYVLPAHAHASAVIANIAADAAKPIPTDLVAHPDGSFRTQDGYVVFPREDYFTSALSERKSQLDNIKHVLTTTAPGGHTAPIKAWREAALSQVEAELQRMQGAWAMG